MNSVLANVGAQQKDLIPLNKIPFYAEHDFTPPSNLIGAFHGGDHLAAFEDTTTGQAAVYPNLGDQTPVLAQDIPAFLNRASSLAKETLAAKRLFPQDSTHPVLNPALPLDGSVVTTRSKPSRTTALLAYVPVARKVGQYPVEGTGSTAYLAFDAKGKVEGFMRNWKSATTFATVMETRSKARIAQLIAAQLAALKPLSARVLNVSIAYYDGNKGYMQPVYRFRARVDYDTSANSKRAADFEVGYVGIGKLREPIPSLGSTLPGPMPGSDQRNVALRTVARSYGVDPCVGRYVVRNDDADWVNSANGFYAGLSSYGGSAWFANCQYYWGIQWQYDPTSPRVNSMNYVDSEGHGDWWGFTTLRNCCDAVDADLTYGGAGDYLIPFPGYGAAAGGNLDYWIIHSCEVIPAPSDTALWANPWWNMFGGLHSVMGYRTIMYIGDGAMYPYGLQLRLAAPAVAAWLGTVISLPAYSGGPTGTMHGVVKHLGRPSAISMTSQINNSAYDISAQPRAGSLTIFWYPG